MKTKVLVTGGAGFIGSHVTDLLIDKGYEVTVLDDLSTGKIENVNPGASFIPGDITNSQTWEKLDNCEPFEYIFHLAALARIQPSILNPLSAHEVNLTGTLRVLEYCRKYNAKIIFSGSSSVYEGTDIPTNEYGIKDPKSPYALQKMMSEDYIHIFHKLYGVKFAILRYFNVFGERQITEGAYAAIVGIFLDQKAKGLPLTITNDGEQLRDFTYVKDVARANYMAMDWGGVTNVGTGKNCSINQLADWVGGEKEYIGERLGEARVTLADNSRAIRFGWEPTKDIETWINEQ